VLEIGPGLGLLTGGLLARGGRHGRRARRRSGGVRRATVLAGGRRRSAALIEGDALDQDLTGSVTPPYDVVANLPYHITSPILHALLGATPRPRRLVLMVQREVAERIARRPGR
jgi:16S rRNA (adenine1518-N6/adenine1519-N6)-dimethyltransferase